MCVTTTPTSSMQWMTVTKRNWGFIQLVRRLQFVSSFCCEQYYTTRHSLQDLPARLASELRLSLSIPSLQLMLLVKLPYMLFVSGYRWYSELWSRSDETLFIQTRKNALVAGLNYVIVCIHQYGNGLRLQGNLIRMIVSNIICILLLSFNV